MIGAAVDPTTARRDAREILDGARFHPKDPPRPLAGVLRWIGDRLEPVGRAIAWFWRNTLGRLPGDWPVIVAIGVLVVVLVMLLRVGLRRRADRRAAADAGAPAGATGGTARPARPEELELAADAAQAAGDHDLAVRLRYRAGVLRLDRDAHAVVARPDLTTAAVRDTLRDTRFDALADDFEIAAYSDDHVTAERASAARAEWPRVVETARRG